MGYAVLFPGQGSQFVGMGKDLFETRSDLLGDPADQILGFSLRRLCLEGPEDELTRTEHAQPALFAISFALWEQLRSRLAVPPMAAAGHSLGEYTALAAAGVLAYEQTLAVVAERGRAMADAADSEPSGMAALLGAAVEAAEVICADRRQQGGRLWVANVNAPGQVVVAGGAEDIAWLESNAGDLGVRRVVPLKVAGAFHSPLMEPAAERVAVALAATDPQPGAFPVWGNVAAAPMPTDEVETLLARQVVCPVRFAESLAGMAASGASLFVHVGPGDVTVGMAKRSVPRVGAMAVSTTDDIDSAVAAAGRTMA